MQDTVVHGVDSGSEESFRVSFLSEFFGGWTDAPGEMPGFSDWPTLVIHHMLFVLSIQS